MLVALATLLAVACGEGSGPSEPAENALVVPVALNEFSVAMERTEIPVGVPVRFEIVNEGTIAHNLVLERKGAQNEPLVDGYGRPAAIPDFSGGAERSLEFTFTEAGEYQLGCHLPGHFEAGMYQAFTAK